MSIDLTNELTITEQIDNLTRELEATRQDLSDIKETLVRSEGIITKVASEVMPTLESLMKSPMLKMFLPKVK